MAKRCPKPERGWRGAGACVWVQAAGTQLCKQGRSGWGGGNGAKLPRLRAPKVFPAVHPASKGELAPRCPCWGALKCPGRWVHPAGAPAGLWVPALGVQGDGGLHAGHLWVRCVRPWQWGWGLGRSRFVFLGRLELLGC